MEEGSRPQPLYLNTFQFMQLTFLSPLTSSVLHTFDQMLVSLSSLDRTPIGMAQPLAQEAGRKLEVTVKGRLRACVSADRPGRVMPAYFTRDWFLGGV